MIRRFFTAAALRRAEIFFTADFLGVVILLNQLDFF